MTKKDNGTQDNDQVFPPLYNNLVPLNPEKHKNLTLVENQDYSFAAKVNAVPIVIKELASASKHFPIVFAGDGSGSMLAVLGLKPDENLFVDEDGKWKEGVYIPSYIRRYPFYIAKSSEVEGPILCFDDTSNLVNQKTGKQLIKDGEVQDDMKKIADFANNIQNFLEMTSLYGVAAEKKGLLEAQNVQLKLGDEVQAQVDGFKTVKREKFDALDGKTLKNWLNKDWIDATVLHLSSGENFNRLWEMKLKRDGKAKA